ncbi:hypothetical protein ACT4UM_11600, partial [Bacillus sp. SS-TM]
MYCRTCGKQHGEEVNYCPNEGSMEIAGAIDAVTLEKDTAKYCRGCGNNLLLHHVVFHMCDNTFNSLPTLL